MGKMSKMKAIKKAPSGYMGRFLTQRAPSYFPKEQNMLPYMFSLPNLASFFSSALHFNPFFSLYHFFLPFIMIFF